MLASESKFGPARLFCFLSISAEMAGGHSTGGLPKSAYFTIPVNSFIVEDRRPAEGAFVRDGTGAPDQTGLSAF